jgi:hypothetical protein
VFNPFCIYGAKSFSSIGVSYNKKGNAAERQELLFMYDVNPKIKNANYYILHTYYTDKKSAILNQAEWLKFYECVIKYYKLLAYFKLGGSNPPKESVLLGTLKPFYAGKETEMKIYFFRKEGPYDKTFMIDIPNMGTFYYDDQNDSAGSLSNVFTPKQIGENDAKIREEKKDTNK